MPILDKLTTVIEWEVDTSQLEKYEKLLQDVGIDTSQLAGMTGRTSAEIDDLGDSATETAADMDRAGREADDFGSALTGLGFAAEKSASDIAKAEKEAADFASGLDKLSADIKDTASGILKLGSIAAGVFTSLGIMSTKETAANTRLAETVGVTAEKYMAWDRVMENIGMDGERVLDLIEEGTNKLGELQGLGEMTSARESLQMLGIEFANIRDLSPEEQFREIMSTAKELGDEKIAKSAVDMIFGGEANRILGHLRTYDESLDDILDKYQRYNFLTERGAEQSEQLAETFNNMELAASSLFQEAIGRAAEEIAPFIEQMFDWVAANRELIDQKIDDIASSLATAFRWLAWAGERVIKIVDALGGAENTIKGVASAFAAWKLAKWTSQLSDLVTNLSKASIEAGALKGATQGLKSVGLTGLFTLAALAVEDLYYYLTGGKSAFDEWSKQYIPEVEESLLSLFGVINDDMSLDEKQQAIAGWHQTFLGAIDDIISSMNSYVDEFNSADKEVTAFFNSVALGFLEADKHTTAFLNSAYDVISGFLSRIWEAVDGAFSKVASFLKSVPFIGDLIGDDTTTVPVGNAPTPPAPDIDWDAALSKNLSFITASSQMAANIAKMSAPSTAPSVTNQTSSVNAPITINATPGMDENAVARAVSRELSATFADVKTTGIKR